MKTPGMTEILQLLNGMIKQGQVDAAIKAEAQIRAANPLAKFPSVSCALELEKFVTCDTDLLALKEDIKILAVESDSVLINGESGVGKDIIARSLHAHRTGPYVAINCTSLPDYLLESELFGHVKGAFTGADKDKVGLFQHAWNGTVFLDEIGDMPLALQAKLLRVLQSHRIRRVGSNDEIPINARFVSATNQSMSKMLCDGRFRRDLYWRLSTFEFTITPLRERPGDIEVVARYYGADDKCVGYLKSLIGKSEFTGNVREVQRIIKRYLVLDKLG